MILNERTRSVVSLMVFVVGVIAAAVAGVTAYRARGIYGGPITTGYHREWDAAEGRYQLVHETTSKAGVHIRRLIGEGLEVKRMFVNGAEVDLTPTKSAPGNETRQGFSTRNDGVIDAWSTVDPSSGTVRVEVSSRRDGVIDRWERYAKGKLIRVDLDTNGNGKADRWMTYEDGILIDTMIDADEDGRPDAPPKR